MMTLYGAIEKACKELPLNYHFNLCIENGYAGISIYGPGGELNFDTADLNITQQVLEAVALVKNIGKGV